MNLFIRQETLASYVRLCPITSLVIAVNLLIFLYYKFVVEDSLLYYAWGVFNVQLVEQGEWYRLFTGMFTHFDFIHFFLNMISLYLFASVAEQLTARWKFALIYFGSGILSYLIVYFMSDVGVTVGASGAIFAVMGALLYMTRKRPELFWGGAKQTLYMMILINVVATFLVPDISIAGHLGGLLMGYLLAGTVRMEET